jgi:ArsR family transcriptional regulator
MKDSTKEQAAIFSALADPTRLKLLKLLCHQHEPDALCVNAMVGLLGVSQPAISQHLRVLRSVGLIKGERRGYHVHYAVDAAILDHYKALVSEVLSAGEQGKEEPCQGCNVNNGGRGKSTGELAEEA